MVTGLQLDLATLVARLEQIREEGYDNGHWLVDRVITCDLPRLERHLSGEARQAIDDAWLPARVREPEPVGRRLPWWARRFRPPMPRLWKGDQA